MVPQKRKRPMFVTGGEYRRATLRGHPELTGKTAAKQPPLSQGCILLFIYYYNDYI